MLRPPNLINNVSSSSGSDMTPEEIRDALQTLSAGNRLSVSFIQDAQPQTEALTQILSVSMTTDSILYKTATGFDKCDLMAAGREWLSFTTVDQQKAHLALANVASSGSYSDLSGKPSIPTATSSLTNDSGFITSIPEVHWDDVQDKPLTFPASVHNHTINDVTGLQGALDSKLNSASAFSGSYNDLTSKPALFDGAYNSLTGKPVLFDGTYNALTGKPTLFSGSYADLSNKPTIPTNNNQLTNGSAFVTASGASSAAPVQSVAGRTGSVTLASTDVSGLATVASSGNYNDLSNKPTIPSTTGLRRVETFLGTTNASGDYVLTFLNTYSVAPDVQAQVLPQLTNNQIVRVSAVSTTGCTIKVEQRNAVTLLAVEVLLASVVNVNGAAVSVQVTPRS